MDHRAPPASRPGYLAQLYHRPWLLLTLAPLFWSGNFVVGRAVHESVPPIGLAFWRWLVAALLLVGFALPHLRRDWPVLQRHWPLLLLLSTVGIACFNTLVYIGLNTTTAINALLLQSTMPVMIVALSFLFFRERVSLQLAAGIAVSLAGAVLIIARGELSVLTTLSLNRGDLWVLAAVICYAVYAVLLRRRPTLHPLSFLTATFGLGALLLAPLYCAETLAGRAMAFTPVTVGAVAYVAIFPSILAYLCFNRGVDLAGASRAGLFIHLMPVFGSVLAMTFLGERFGWFHGAGVVLILGGIALVTRSRG
jgi:drug/metabolite transporter (DMT)-like permease